MLYKDNPVITSQERSPDSLCKTAQSTLEETEQAWSTDDGLAPGPMVTEVDMLRMTEALIVSKRFRTSFTNKL